MSARSLLLGRDQEQVLDLLSNVDSKERKLRILVQGGQGLGLPQDKTPKLKPQRQDQVRFVLHTPATQEVPPELQITTTRM